MVFLVNLWEHEDKDRIRLTLFLLLVNSHSWKVGSLEVTSVHLAVNEMRLGARRSQIQQRPGIVPHTRVSSS